MNLSFIHLDGFTREWKRCKLSDDDLSSLETQLMEHPDAGVVIAGTGGLRKIRFAPPGRHSGKSGAYRVGYAYYRIAESVLLVTVFAKNDKQNISPAEKAQYKRIIETLQPSRGVNK